MHVDQSQTHQSKFISMSQIDHFKEKLSRMFFKSFNKLLQNCKAFSEFSGWYCRYKGSIKNVESLKLDDPALDRMDVPASLTHSSHPVLQFHDLALGYIDLSGIRPSPMSSALTLEKIEKDFVLKIRQWMELLQVFGTTEEVTLGNLYNLMDYNQYYSSHLAPEVGFISSPIVPQRIVKKGMTGGSKLATKGFMADVNTVDQSVS